MAPRTTAGAVATFRNFAPVELNGRFLGDGGLSANAPIEALHCDPPKGPLSVFVLDLF